MHQPRSSLASSMTSRSIVPPTGRAGRSVARSAASTKPSRSPVKQRIQPDSAPVTPVEKPCLSSYEEEPERWDGMS